jgi:hypothetical protein
MLGMEFFDVAAIIAGILVLTALVMTYVLWSEEGRRSVARMRAETRHTSLGNTEPETRDSEEVSA